MGVDEEPIDESAPGRREGPGPWLWRVATGSLRGAIVAVFPFGLLLREVIPGTDRDDLIALAIVGTALGAINALRRRDVG